MEPPLRKDVPTERERLRRLFRVKQTEGQMIQLRGFTLESVWIMRPDLSFTEPINLTFLQDISLTFDQLLERSEQLQIFSSRQTFSSLYLNPKTQERALVLYLRNEPGKQVAKEDMGIVRKYVKIPEMANIRMILVTETGLNPGSTDYVTNQVAGRQIDVFKDAELSFNRTKHALAPIKVDYIERKTGENSNDPDTVTQWAEEEGIEPNKLPMIFSGDPLAKMYGAKPTDVFSTIVMGTGADASGYYRVVRRGDPPKK